MLTLNRILRVIWGMGGHLYKEAEVDRNCHLPKITKLHYRGSMTTQLSITCSKKGQWQLWFHHVFPALTTDPGIQKAIKKYCCINN